MVQNVKSLFVEDVEVMYCIKCIGPRVGDSFCPHFVKRKGKVIYHMTSPQKCSFTKTTIMFL